MSKSAVHAVRTEPAPITVLDTEDTPDRRQWLTEDEVEAIIKHAANERDKLMVLIGYRHGLRVSELIHLRWQQVDLDTQRLSVRRLKNGEPSVHPLSGREVRGLRKLCRQQLDRITCLSPPARAGQ